MFRSFTIEMKYLDKAIVFNETKREFLVCSKEYFEAYIACRILDTGMYDYGKYNWSFPPMEISLNELNEYLSGKYRCTSHLKKIDSLVEHWSNEDNIQFSSYKSFGCFAKKGSMYKNVRPPVAW